MTSQTSPIAANANAANNGVPWSNIQAVDVEAGKVTVFEYTNADLTDRIDAVKREMEDKMSEIQKNLEAQFQNVTEKLDQQKVENYVLTTTNKQIKAQLEETLAKVDVKAKMEKLLEERAADLKKEKDALEVEIKTISEQFAQAQKSLSQIALKQDQELKESSGTLHDRVTQLEQENSKLKEQLLAARTIYTELQAASGKEDSPSAAQKELQLIKKHVISLLRATKVVDDQYEGVDIAERIVELETSYINFLNLRIVPLLRTAQVIGAQEVYQPKNLNELGVQIDKVTTNYNVTALKLGTLSTHFDRLVTAVQPALVKVNQAIDETNPKLQAANLVSADPQQQTARMDALMGKIAYLDSLGSDMQSVRSGIRKIGRNVWSLLNGLFSK